jgi:hypothetical protein
MRLPHCIPNAAGHRCVKLPQLFVARYSEFSGYISAARIECSDAVLFTFMAGLVVLLVLLNAGVAIVA